MPLIGVAELALLVVAVALVLTVAIDAARSAPRRAALQRALVGAAAETRGASKAREADAENAVVIALPDGDCTVRVEHAPLDRERVVVSFKLDGEPRGEASGYRARPEADVRGRPWILFRRRVPDSTVEPEEVVVVLLVVARSSGARSELVRILGGEGVIPAVYKLFTDTDVDELVVNRGSATVKAVLRAPRAEQLTTLAMGELAGGVAEIARCFPSFEGPCAMPSRWDVTGAIRVLAALLLATAPLALALAVAAPWTLWPSNAYLLFGGAAVATLFGKASARVLVVASALKSSRVRVARVLLTLAAAAHGSAAAVVINRAGDHPSTTRDAHIYEQSAIALGTRCLVIPSLSLTGALPPWRVSPELRACAKKVTAIVHDGLLGAAWLEELRCTSELVSAPPRSEPVRPSRPHAPLGSPLGVAHLGRVRDKPWYADQFFDVHLHNDSSFARWFLLPTTAAGARLVKTASIRAIALAGSTPVPVLQLGAQAYAVLLPASASVTIEGYRLSSYWQNMPPRWTFEVVAAHEITWQGQPLVSSIAAELAAPAMTTVRFDCTYRSPVCAELGLASATGAGAITLEGVEHLSATVEMVDDDPYPPAR